MHYILYNVLLVLAFPVIVGLLLTKKRSQRGLRFRLGAIPIELQKLSKPVIWIHAVSLGEVAAVVPLLQALKERYPLWPLVVSTVTETGREVVINQLEGVAVHCYAPVDFWWAVNRYVRRLDPHLFVLVESEFWPNLLKSLQRHQIPVCLVNGRISSRSFARYGWIKGIMRRMMGGISLALMQSSNDARRIRHLGALPDIVHVTGNMKFDQSLEQRRPVSDHPSLRDVLQLDPAERLLVAGSTHSQEEETLLKTYREVAARHPRVVLLLAPRHIERADKLEHVIARYGFACVRRSQIGRESSSCIHNRGPRVILLDTRGELPFIYREGFLAFVGGTLVPIGGHNLLEPAQWGRPVLFGPYIDHCRDIANLLLETGGGRQIRNQSDLVSCIDWLLAHPAEAEGIGHQAFLMVQAHRGVIARNLQWIERLLEKKGPASGIVPNTEPASIHFTHHSN